MDLANWTDGELISVRDELQVWCDKRQEITWANRFLDWTGFMGAFAALTGLTDIFFGGPTVTNALLVVLGILASYSWYKGDKQRKKNISFLERLNEELSRRGHES
jgi:membrane protein implicated in regulation of membrane protease activity